MSLEKTVLVQQDASAGGNVSSVMGRRGSSAAWRAAKSAVVTMHRMRELHLIAQKQPSTPQRFARRAGHYLAKPAALVQRARGRATHKPEDYMREFLRGAELEMTKHIERAAVLIESLKFKSTEGVADVSAEEVYANVDRSLMVFEQLCTVKERFDHSQLTLMTKILERAKAYESAGQVGKEPLQVVVLGGGPVGMRSACEMALMGHKVSVLEARDTCSRLNVLKLWEETTIDLDRLGLKSVDADWSNKKQARASTARLQLSLLKVALLLGVHVNVDRTHAKEFELRRASDEGADVLIVATGFRADLYAKLRDTTVVRRYDSGSGESTTTDWSEGFQPMEAGRAPAAAIAVVCHFERNGKSAEAKAWARTFEPFDWTVQDARGADKSEAQLREMQQRYGMFCIAPKALAAEGIHLENIICYSNKGKEPFTAVPPSYYFIFTLKSDMITACRDEADTVSWKLIKPGEGMPAEGGSRALLEWAKSRAAADAGCGVDQAEIDRFVKRVVTLFTEGYVGHKGSHVTAPLPAACPLLRDVTDGFHRSVDIFDFSERNSMKNACEVVTAVKGADEAAAPTPLEKPMLVLSVGDALQEPFWPEGLGINRGMHNALDACWAAGRWGEARAGGDASIAELVRQRQSLYEGKTLQMHGKVRSMLRGYRADNSKSDSPKPAHGYSPDPASRYNAPVFSEERTSRA